LNRTSGKIRCARARAIALAATLAAAAAFAAPDARADALKFRIDAERSTVSAAVAEPVAIFRGRAIGNFRVIAGEVRGDPANIQDTAKVRLMIDATSYRSDSPSRDRKVTASSLQSDKYPTIGFESTSVIGFVATGANEGTTVVNGTLTIHATTHPIAVPVHAALAADGTLVADGEVTFNYEEYGVKVPSVLFGAFEAGDEATVRFHIVAVNEAAPASGTASAKSAPASSSE
jgi:polyisoprenoid-binding protein YceI